MPDRPTARRVPAGAGELKLADYGREHVPADAGARWTSEELRRDFEVIGFQAPYVMVRRRSDGVEGTLEFVHSPRIYFSFVPRR